VDREVPHRVVYRKVRLQWTLVPNFFFFPVRGQHSTKTPTSSLEMPLLSLFAVGIYLHPWFGGSTREHGTSTLATQEAAVFDADWQAPSNPLTEVCDNLDNGPTRRGDATCCWLLSTLPPTRLVTEARIRPCDRSHEPGLQLKLQALNILANQWLPRLRRASEHRDTARYFASSGGCFLLRARH
jgi:hypothetical protein